jgi:uncharacterized phage-associated protein
MFTDLGLNSVDVAKAIRYSAKQKGVYANMTQINKLLYIIYGMQLVQSKQRLTEEHSAAWPYGPVFPRVHKQVKLSDEITSQEYDKIKQTHPDIVALIDEVVSKFSGLSAGELSEWSHQSGSPWDIAVKNSKGKWNTKLGDDDIYNYFYSFAN